LFSAVCRNAQVLKPFEIDWLRPNPDSEFYVSKFDRSGKVVAEKSPTRMEEQFDAVTECLSEAI